MAKINADDERNIKYWAGRYKCREVSFEDLQQEGRLAVLEAKEDSHKYYKMWIAIHRYAEKNRKGMKRGPRNMRTECIEPVADIDAGLQLVENEDTLQHILTTANLSHEELLIFRGVCSGETTVKEMSEALGLTRQGVYFKLTEAVRKCKNVAEKGEQDV